MKVFNLANTGADPSDELTDGIRHKVTITVSNPWGADDLNLNFTLFSKFPITRAMVMNVITFTAFENYVLEDFDEKIIQEPAESVTLTDDDYESTDSWLMKKHDGKQILEIFNGDAVVEEDIDRINYHNDG